MKKKFLGLALVVVAITITSICLCGFGVKISDISDEDMNNITFGGNPISTRSSVWKTLPFDTCELAVNHTVTDIIPNLQRTNLPNMHPAMSVGNVIAHSQRNGLPQLVAGGSIFIGGAYDNSGTVAVNMMANLYGKMGLASGTVTFTTIKNAYSYYAFEQSCYATVRQVATNAKYIVPEKLDACMVTNNIPLMLYTQQVEVVDNIIEGANSLNIQSSMIYANQVYSAFKYERYHYTKDGIAYDEMFVTCTDYDGRNICIRLGGSTMIYRVEGLYFIN